MRGRCARVCGACGRALEHAIAPESDWKPGTEACAWALVLHDGDRPVDKLRSIFPYRLEAFLAQRRFRQVRTAKVTRSGAATHDPEERTVWQVQL